MPSLLADRYQQRLETLSYATAARLLNLWNAVIAAGGGEDEWIAAAKPALAASATTAASLSSTYAALTDPDGATGTISALIVPDAAARAHAPLLEVNRLLTEGADWASATRLAASTVEAVGSDSVMATGRQALAARIPDTRAIRRLDAKACDWCLSISGVVWPSLDAASFGHPSCHCTAVPIADAGDHNDRMRERLGWDPQRAVTYKVRDQIRRLRESEDLAKRRSAAARKEALTEIDPDRIERLSIREQDWETRAERAAERRRILETGTHRLPE